MSFWSPSSDQNIGTFLEELCKFLLNICTERFCSTSNKKQQIIDLNGEEDEDLGKGVEAGLS